MWIALGGAAGTVCRYWVSTRLAVALGPAFPWGTLAVNLVGSTLLGLLSGLASSSTVLGPTTLLALTTGFMGGFTTFSTFSLDTFKFLQAGSPWSAAGYVLVTVVGCLLGTWGGVVVGLRLGA